MWGFGRQSWRSTRVLSCTWWQHMAASWYATTYALALVLSQLDKPKFLHECSMISGIICEVAYIRCPHHDQSKVESLGTQQTWTSQKVKRPFGEKTMHMLCGINVWLLQTPWGEVLSTNCDYYGNRLLINDYLKNILWKLRVYIYIYLLIIDIHAQSTYVYTSAVPPLFMGWRHTFPNPYTKSVNQAFGSALAWFSLVLRASWEESRHHLYLLYLQVGNGSCSSLTCRFM